MSQEDHHEIRDLIENWAVWRDAGFWDRFLTCWHPDGVMMATWFQGPAKEFVRVSREGWEKGVSILHFLGGTSIDIAGDRAVAQTKMTISQRGPVEGETCDIVCTGRFHDFIEKHEGAWKIRLRQPIYEKDICIPVTPGARIDLDQALLQRFPQGYRHLAYVQTRIGYAVKTDMPGLRGPKVEALYALGRSWLDGGSVEGWS